MHRTYNEILRVITINDSCNLAFEIKCRYKLKKKLNNEISKSNRQIAETEAKSIPQKHKFMTCNPVYGFMAIKTFNYLAFDFERT
jgi:hypothetical protein